MRDGLGGAFCDPTLAPAGGGVGERERRWESLTRPDDDGEFLQLFAGDFDVADFEKAGEELGGLGSVEGNFGERRRMGCGANLGLGLCVPNDGHGCCCCVVLMFGCCWCCAVKMRECW